MEIDYCFAKYFLKLNGDGGGGGGGESSYLKDLFPCKQHCYLPNLMLYLLCSVVTLLVFWYLTHDTEKVCINDSLITANILFDY